MYSYDDNGNQTTRAIGADTYNLDYDAENRLVEVRKNDIIIAAFTFDGDGKRVKSVMDSETILFVGGHYEIKNPGAGQEITKYYWRFPHCNAQVHHPAVDDGGILPQ